METPTRSELGDNTTDIEDASQGDDDTPDDDVSRASIDQATALKQQSELDEPQGGPQQQGVGKEDLDEVLGIFLQLRIRGRLALAHLTDAIDGIGDADVANGHGGEAGPCQADDDVFDQPETSFPGSNAESDGGERGCQCNHAKGKILSCEFEDGLDGSGGSSYLEMLRGQKELVRAARRHGLDGDEVNRLE